MGSNKTIDQKIKESDEALTLLRSISNRIAQVEKKIINMERDKRTYRAKREKKEESTLDIIKKEIQKASDNTELSKWKTIKDRALYIGVALALIYLPKIINFIASHLGDIFK